MYFFKASKFPILLTHANTHQFSSSRIVQGWLLIFAYIPTLFHISLSFIKVIKEHYACPPISCTKDLVMKVIHLLLNESWLKNWFLINTIFSFFQATVYKTGSGLCSAFLANTGTNSDVTVKFNGNSYLLPAWSVSILPDCKNVVFNTAKVCLVSFIMIFS